MKFCLTSFFALLLTTLSELAAAPACYHITLAEALGKIEARHQTNINRRLSINRWNRDTLPQLRSATEIYLVPPTALTPGEETNFIASELRIVMVSNDQLHEGQIDLWMSDDQEWESLPIQLDRAQIKPGDEAILQQAREWHAWTHSRNRGPGTAWFRHQLGEKDVERPGQRRQRDLDNSFTTLTGGRAIAENLSLDRDLILARDKDEKTVPLRKIKGVTVEAIPWQERMPKGEIKIDALAQAVPADQHLLVVPSLSTLLSLLDRLENEGTPIFQTFSVRNVYRELPLRYRRQLGLDLPDALAKLLPVKSVGVTGGDPFFPTGSDVAVLFEADDPEAIFKQLTAILTGKAQQLRLQPKADSGYWSCQNQTRSFSSHLAIIGQVVVVSNSAKQIERLKAVAAGQTPALGNLEEYRFFRHRYPMSAEEDAYLFISDPTLRRWSGPRIRISVSRRNRALAALGSLTSQLISTGQISTNVYAPLTGPCQILDGSVHSKVFGSHDFLTPCAELELDSVTLAEKEAYDRWREGYESGWARFFDPIALRLKLTEKNESIGLSVLPLRVESDYEEFISIVGDARLSRAATQPVPGAVFQYSMAIDRESPLFKMAETSISGFLPGLKINPLSWLGNSVSLIGEPSLAWQAVADDSIQHDGAWAHLPLLARIECSSSLKLGFFLTAIKGMAMTSAPGATQWETRTYQDLPYVAVTEKQWQLGLSIFYATTPTSLLISLREDTLQRALVREAQLPKDLEKRAQIDFKGSLDFLRASTSIFGNKSLEERRREQSFRALPILNEWKRRFGQDDPVAYHRIKYGTHLTCPGGKGYRWNAEAKTMESIAYGHPTGIKEEPKALDLLNRFKFFHSQADFDDDGLRLAAQLDTTSPTPLVLGTPRPDQDIIQLVNILDTHGPRKRVFEVVEEGKDPIRITGELKILKDTDGELLYEIHQQGPDEDSDFTNVTRKQFNKTFQPVFWKSNGRQLRYDQVQGVPAELWVGQIAPTSVQGQMIDGYGQRAYKELGFLEVIGWEDIALPNGESLHCLKTVATKEVITGQSFFRQTYTDWSAPNFGTVKWESRNDDWVSTATLISYEKE